MTAPAISLRGVVGSTCAPLSTAVRTPLPSAVDDRLAPSALARGRRIFDDLLVFVFGGLVGFGEPDEVHGAGQQEPSARGHEGGYQGVKPVVGSSVVMR